MVQSGQAFVYRQYLGRCDRQAYLAAEHQAQAQRVEQQRQQFGQ